MSVVGRVRAAVRGVPAYVAFRRWQREGFVRAFRRHQLWKKVLATAPVRTESVSPAGPEVHLLCYRLDYLPAIWALKTFYRTSGVQYPLCVHVNGPAERVVYARFRHHFPDARIVSQHEADAVVVPALRDRGLARLTAARAGSPFVLKLTDYSLLARGGTVLGIDADILFFSEPRELVAAAQEPGLGYTFQRDPASTYNLTPECSVREFGINLAPRVNTGLLIYPAGLPDLSAFERYLTHPDVATPNGFIEQTLYALHASELGRVAYLPDSYAIDLRPAVPFDGLVCRHYAGNTRHLMTTEGMPQVLRTGIFAGTGA
ncbi:Uncharacterized protein OS=Anabaena cylindrica (strain ATCC 27899 / PCC 7122) GN=Anacy_3786 PE=4 SV=1 [Gemmataceae bacterium]|nr:Uncharacterized protein OS=Anabaena cylindrica (strain ATCC 27899 / PCC 7122) GN=Anacy_3786 PE=4 SV=1 [Gemmataceae bacterium]VTU00936.1 Uncharacterized protein OS=Anabaena cylindrica (strain ATCC 27899 / PCC 7122) GN=Anacy_3786 PE=4 SV=1 [Gemmataceae bacterium]